MSGLYDAPVIGVGEEAELRYIGGDDIRLESKFFHQGEELIGKHIVGNAVVSHDRVYQKETVIFMESVKKPENLPDLLFACHESGVDAVEPRPHLLPFPPEMLHLICAVGAVIAGVSGLGA